MIRNDFLNLSPLSKVRFIRFLSLINSRLRVLSSKIISLWPHVASCIHYSMNVSGIIILLGGLGDEQHFFYHQPENTLNIRLRILSLEMRVNS